MFNCEIWLGKTEVEINNKIENKIENNGFLKKAPFIEFKLIFSWLKLMLIIFINPNNPKKQKA